MHKCSRRRSETPHQTRSPISLTWWWTNHLCQWFEELRRYLSLHLLLTDVRDYLSLWYFSPNSIMPLAISFFLLYPHSNGFLGLYLFVFATICMSFVSIVEMCLFFWILIDHFSLFDKQQPSQPSLPITEKVWKSRIHAFEFMSLLYNSSQGSSLTES